MIALGSDHGGYELKEQLKQHLKEKGIEFKDYGTYSPESIDYPDIAKPVCDGVISGEADAAVLMCGTGIGVSVAANKIKGIRAALCGDVFSAKMAKQHNNANVLCIGGRVTGAELAFMIVDTWLDEKFLGGRHLNRIEKVAELEKQGGTGFSELARARYSLRKFSSEPVEKEKLDMVLEAARLAPTAVNFQPQKIVVINDEEVLERLRECTKYCFNAKTVILVCYDKERAWARSADGVNFGDTDAAIAVTHMMLQAADIGLGTTYVGAFDPEKLRKAMNIPDKYIPAALLPIGYPAEDAKPSDMHEKRIPVEDMVLYNRFE